MGTNETGGGVSLVAEACVPCVAVPADSLSDEQAANFGRFAGKLSRVELERFFYLDDADRSAYGL